MLFWKMSKSVHLGRKETMNTRRAARNLHRTLSKIFQLPWIPSDTSYSSRTSWKTTRKFAKGITIPFDHVTTRPPLALRKLASSEFRSSLPSLKGVIRTLCPDMTVLTSSITRLLGKLEFTHYSDSRANGFSTNDFEQFWSNSFLQPKSRSGSTRSSQFQSDAEIDQKKLKLLL